MEVCSTKDSLSKTMIGPGQLIGCGPEGGIELVYRAI